MLGKGQTDQNGRHISRDFEKETSKQFEKLFASKLEAVLPQLRAFAFSLARNHAVADDLVQIACLKAWNGRNRYDPDRSMLGWMRRIVKNVFIDDFRAKSRRANLLLSIEESDFVSILSPASEHQDGMLDLLNAMNALNSVERSVVLLRAMSGYSYDQIAQQLGISPGNARKYTRAACQS